MLLYWIISVLGTRVLRLSVEADIATGAIESFRDWHIDVSVPIFWKELCSGTLFFALPSGLDLSLTSCCLPVDC